MRRERPGTAKAPMHIAGSRGGLLSIRGLWGEQDTKGFLPSCIECVKVKNCLKPSGCKD